MKASLLLYMDGFIDTIAHTCSWSCLTAVDHLSLPHGQIFNLMSRSPLLARRRR